MKSAKELLEKAGYDESVIGHHGEIDILIECMKYYAKQCAKQALNDAAESPELTIVNSEAWEDICDVDFIKEIILKTEIKTP